MSRVSGYFPFSRQLSIAGKWRGSTTCRKRTCIINVYETDVASQTRRDGYGSACAYICETTTVKNKLKNLCIKYKGGFQLEDSPLTATGEPGWRAVLSLLKAKLAGSSADWSPTERVTVTPAPRFLQIEILSVQTLQKFPG